MAKFDENCAGANFEKEDKAIKIGLDLDGVVASHPLGGFWIVARKLKEKVLKRANYPLYYYPSTIPERLAWVVINWLRSPTQNAKDTLSSFSKHNGIKLYLVTTRFKFLEKLTFGWLKKHRLCQSFSQILINTENLDPPLFKSQMINRHTLSFFVDDDLETIAHLKKTTKAKFYWIVPSHRRRGENNHQEVESCKDLTEALMKIEAQLDK